MSLPSHVQAASVSISASARTTMTDLLTRLWFELNDPSGPDQVFTDVEGQSILDDHSTLVRYLPLEPVATIASGGALSYLTYEAPFGFWESDARLYDSSYNEILTSSQDYLRGRWTLQEAHWPPVMVTGTTYNLYAAAADLADAWAARVKLDFDVTLDGQTSARRSQKMDMLRQHAKDLRARARSDSVSLYRSDT